MKTTFKKVRTAFLTCVLGAALPPDAGCSGGGKDPKANFPCRQLGTRVEPWMAKS